MKLTSLIRSNYIYISPFLVSLYAVLFLFVQNQHEYRTNVLFTPLLVSLIFSSIVFGVVLLIFRKLAPAALLSSAIIFVCLSYGRFIEILKDAPLKIGSYEISPETIVLSLAAAFVFVAIFVCIKYRKKLKKAAQIVTLLFLLLIGIQVFQIVSFELQSGRVEKKTVPVQKIQTNKSAQTKGEPDIYYFIFDRYAGPTSTAEQYGFDNSPFYTYLEDKGFYVAKNSRTNYPKTFLSLGSSLNMEYLDFLTKETKGGASKDESIVTPYIENSKVLKFLKNKGYTFVNVGSWWTPTKKNKNADYSFYPTFKEYGGADEFTTGFYNTTIAAQLLKLVLRNPEDVSSDPSNNSHRQAALYQFKAFEQVPSIKGPKFVFTHILLPHDPFVFDKNCNPISEKIVKQNTHQVNYINQLQCANIHIKQIIDQILKESKTPPVIVLQSDEGPFPMNVSIPEKQGWGSAKTTSLREKFPILNAYYFPETEETAVENRLNAAPYDTITPVNSFRVLFNKYFKTNMELLEDKSYVFKDQENYYNFTDVTDKVK